VFINGDIEWGRKNLEYMLIYFCLIIVDLSRYKNKIKIYEHVPPKYDILELRDHEKYQISKNKY
jgi:hypothetical protein